MPKPSFRRRMSPGVKDRLINTVDLIYKPALNEEEYEQLVEAAQWRGCPYCGDRFNVKKGFDGPDTGKGTRYCSPGCVGAAERCQAPLIKPEPAFPSICIDGIDV